MKVDSSISAVITGGASGLGLATARALAEAGARVALFDMNADAGEAAAAELDGVFCQVDVTNEAAVDAAFARARDAIGQERVLVNCAGIGNAIKTASRGKEPGEVKHFPIDAFNKVIQVNLVGTFTCIAKSAMGMLSLDPLEDGERGVIVNTASVAAEDGQMGQAAYAASKAGIVGMTLPIARDLMSEGIRVNTILPGIFNTPLLASAPEHVLQGLSASVPFPKRLGQPPEYARLAMTMIETGYFNGEDVRLDGAIRMAPR
ncbi:SDR family NAD(P)-dependent oxidoreductase [Maricaulis parjimensis]|uniref:SDR family NAD(P)-dependent oxidoreductase n=1 Tax=Maricaulis parjimensis TaxID=144023 RepID=UPI00193A7AA5|nr:SDR family NAD(P)-dependent oxidoreductase [Maricaulis parjimensis]